MSIIDGAKSEVVEIFDGADTLKDIIDLDPGQASLALNSEFIPGQVRTRRGFLDGIPLAASGGITPAYILFRYWVQGQTGAQKRYIVFAPTASAGSGPLYVYDLDSATRTLILTWTDSGSGVGLIIAATMGQRLYVAFLDNAGGSSSSGYVWDGNLAHSAIRAFQRPMLTTEVTLTVTSPGAGVCTAGTHSVGVLFETLAGYWTRPGPADANIKLVPTTFTASGSGNMQATLHLPAGTWPSWVKACQIIYTTAQNNFQYYVVPGTITPITAGGAADVVVTWNISDIQLRSIGSQGAGTLADDYFGLFSMDSSNNPPFAPTFVIPWGNRLVWFGNYGGIDSFFPSDQGSPEWISPDQHIQQLPAGLPISTAFVLRGILYVASPSGSIYGYVDNRQRPVNFSPPHEVDGSIGTSAPLGVTTDSSGNGYALVAAPQGCYLFPGGAFPSLPLSFEATPDWEQIDWSKPLAIQVKDFPQDKLFLAKANLLAGAGTRLFTFNYLKGTTPDKINYSIWGISGRSGGVNVNWPIGLIEIVQKNPGNFWELWLAIGTGGAAAPSVRQMSIRAGDALATLYQDLGASSPIGIDWEYQLAPLPRKSQMMLQHLAVRVRVGSLLAANSNLYVSVTSIDGSRVATVVGNPFSVAQKPDQPLLIPYDMQNEQALYLFTNGGTSRITTNQGLFIALLEHYYTLMETVR